MGLFGGGDTDAFDEMQARMDDQQRQADAQLETKRQDIVRQRMQIVKSVGGPEWSNPDAPAQIEAETSQQL